jgi:galactokinase
MLESEEGPERLEHHVQRFEACFGAGGLVRLFFAPGRVNLMGAHLDYNGGPVMPMAIDRGTFLAVRERSDDRICLRSTSESTALEVGLAECADLERSGQWFDYPGGVVRALLRAGASGPGLDVLFGGDLPVGAGLSSSASICVGTALAFDALWGLGRPPLDRVHDALFAEREFVGVQCGIMDPYAVGLARPGHLLWLDCKDSAWAHLPIGEGVAVAVADTGVRRELAQGEFNRRVAQARAAFEALRPHAPEATCLRDISLEVLRDHEDELDPVLARRARHVLEEVQRTYAARESLMKGDLAGFGACMSASHTSLRDLYEVSVPELDCLVDAALGHPSVLGTRLTGAGFGGCVVVLARDGARKDLTRWMGDAFERSFGRRPAIEFFGGDRGPREIPARVSAG